MTRFSIFMIILNLFWPKDCSPYLLEFNAPPSKLMSETKCVGDYFEMLVTAITYGLPITAIVISNKKKYKLWLYVEKFKENKIKYLPFSRFHMQKFSRISVFVILYDSNFNKVFYFLKSKMLIFDLILRSKKSFSGFWWTVVRRNSIIFV